jgi:hypothetical protein
LLYGMSSSVSLWGTISQAGSGLATRASQLPAREQLWSSTPEYEQFCKGFALNPGCGRPLNGVQEIRPETVVSQMMGMKTTRVQALDLYVFTGNMADLYNLTCCGWSAGGTGTDRGINHYLNPKLWAGMARTNALIKLREDTELQPPANSPYMNQNYFLTEAHTSATYGNELDILCLGENPYGAQSITLPTIAGGTMLKYVLTGYSLTLTVLAGNPTTDTNAEYCASPGQTTTYVALPPFPTVNPVTYHSFSAPPSMPYGATKMFVRFGYYPWAMEGEVSMDCTSGCSSVPLDHHNAPIYVQYIFTDSNGVAKGPPNPPPVAIPSQGLY